MSDLILHPPLWAILIALMLMGCGVIGVLLFTIDWALKRREQGLPMGAVEPGLDSIHGEAVSGSGRVHSHSIRSSRPATMNEIIDSVSWPWRGTPREADPPAPPSTAIVGEGRGHPLAQ